VLSHVSKASIPGGAGSQGTSNNFARDAKSSVRAPIIQLQKTDKTADDLQVSSKI